MRATVESTRYSPAILRSVRPIDKYQPVSKPRGTVLYRVGDEATDPIRLHSGIVALLTYGMKSVGRVDGEMREPVESYSIYSLIHIQGWTFGEEALLGEPHCHEAVVLTTAVVQLMKLNETIRTEVGRQAHRRSGELQALRLLNVRDGLRVIHERYSGLPLGAEIMADLFATSREMVSRCLKENQSLKLVEGRGKGLTVPERRFYS